MLTAATVGVSAAAAIGCGAISGGSLAAVCAIGASGLINVGVDYATGNINSISDALGSFTKGAVVGAITLGVGAVGARIASTVVAGATTTGARVAAGAVTGAATNAVGEYLTTGQVTLANTLMGAAFGGLGGKLANTCRAHSFDPSTKVLVAGGAAVAISSLRVGDEVVATDPETGETLNKPVTAVHVNVDTDLVDVEVQSTPDSPPSTLHTTAHHPFWDDESKQWVNAGDLIPGRSTVIGPDGERQTVRAVRPIAGPQQMRDLTIADLHTYYVMAGNQAVLVHNCDTRIASSDQGRAHNAAAFTENGHNGFSGVYDPISDTFHARVSGGSDPLVSQFGGHGEINNAVFGGSRNTIGFVAIRGEDGVIQMRWNSASVNVRNFGNRAAPEPWRNPIMDAIRRATGHEVVG